MIPKTNFLVALVLTMACMSSTQPSAKAGSPQMRTTEIKADWNFEGHRPRTDAEKAQLGQGALEREAAAKVNAANALGFGPKIELVSIQFKRNECGGSSTKGSRLGSPRKHKCWGTAVGVLVVRMK